MTEIVSFKQSNGKRIEGRLMTENAKTAIVKPYVWLKTETIKIHKTKAAMQYTGKSI